MNGANKKYFNFILNEDAPVFSFSKGKINETEESLHQGTVIQGSLKTRIVNIDKNKIPYKFVEIKGNGGFISPQVVNLYVGDFANLDGSNIKDDTIVKKTALGEAKGNSLKRKNTLINYGLPILGGIVGYQIAKRTGAETKKKIGFILFFGLLGMIPKYIYNK